MGNMKQHRRRFLDGMIGTILRHHNDSLTISLDEQQSIGLDEQSIVFEQSKDEVTKFMVINDPLSRDCSITNLADYDAIKCLLDIAKEVPVTRWKEEDDVKHQKSNALTLGVTK